MESAAQVTATTRSVGRPIVHSFWRDLWLKTALEGLILAAVYFVAWEMLERLLSPDLRASTIHALHIVRGLGAAFLLGTWSFLRIRRARLDSDIEMNANLALLERRVDERTHELREARAFTELLFDSLRERIIVIGPDGRIVKANRVAGEDLVGKMRSEVEAGESGRVWEVETITIPSQRGSESDYTLEVGRDVTEAKNLEAQVRHQEKMASLGILTAGFAHDLGNPLASLSAELEFLALEDDVDELRGSLGVLREHVGRMTRTLREMVDFARRRRDQMADVSIACAVTDSARLVRHDPRWKQVNLVVDVGADLSAVRMVEDHLVLVFINLMLNAADAMPQGGTMTISARQHGRDVEIDVEDTGQGMTKDVLARAKTPLFTTKGARGTGLGLAVCESIVRSASGHLDLSSTPNVGTRVTVRLPATKGDAIDA
jgi:signal transduction histidine kinase